MCIVLIETISYARVGEMAFIIFLRLCLAKYISFLKELKIEIKLFMERRRKKCWIKMA